MYTHIYIYMYIYKISVRVFEALGFSLGTEKKSNNQAMVRLEKRESQ